MSESANACVLLDDARRLEQVQSPAPCGIVYNRHRLHFPFVMLIGTRAHDYHILSQQSSYSKQAHSCHGSNAGPSDFFRL